MWLYKLLKIIKPKVILSMSYLASTALETNQGILNDDDEWQFDDEQQIEQTRWLQYSGKVSIFDHQLVVITMLHPGYFAYNPSIQRLLYSVYLCQVALTIPHPKGYYIPR